MSDEKWIASQLEMAKDALAKDVNREGPFGWDFGKHRRFAEERLKDVLDSDPFNKKALDLYQGICLREISEAVDENGELLWTAYYHILIRISLTLIEKYPDTYEAQERILLTYVFSAFDPYLYFRKAKIDQRLSFNNLQIFYNLLKSWYDKFSSNVRGFVLSEGLSIVENILDKDITSFKYAIYKEAKNRIFIYEGERIPVGDSRGSQYITVLLEHPLFRFNVYQLIEAVEGQPLDIVSENAREKQENGLKDQGLIVSKSQNLGHKMDTKGIAKIKKWIAENQKKIDEGDYKDEAERDKLQAEVEKGEDYLIDTLDHRGKSKFLGDEEAKSIGSAQTAIKRAREEINNVSLPLFEHLNAIRLMDREFVYFPDRKIEWVVLNK